MLQPMVLSVYNIWVLKISNSKAWRCPSSLQLEHYNAHVGQKHLDVGVGNGWYLMRATFPDHADITLFDLNSNALRHTKKRLARYEPNLRAVVGDVYSPTGLDDIKPFDSIGLSYLLHCLPGTMKDKSFVFKKLAPLLKEDHLSNPSDGVLFGATILGKGVKHNWFGRKLSSVYNKKGVFCNRYDDEEGLRKALEESFDEVTLTVHGTVALFSASKPS